MQLIHPIRHPLMQQLAAGTASNTINSISLPSGNVAIIPLDTQDIIFYISYYYIYS
jgi:hypothetical protein